jgi:peptidoglycan/xylan/chitin deacetylase (PgdA/CDA1 family)
VRIPGLRSLQLSARWLRSRFTNGVLILGYHRISESARDPYSLCVTPQHFAEQLEVLIQMGEVISLREVASSLLGRRVPKRAAVLTFDDGYADLLPHATPLLERYQAPATVFVATGILGGEFWWDKLERVIYSSARLPEQLVGQVGDGSYEWVPGGPGERPAPGARRDLLRSVYRALLRLSPQERDRAISGIAAWSGTAPDDRPPRRAMTGDELVKLAACNLIDVGAHTVTHPFLADLPREVQRAEIQDSKAHLEQILGQPVTAFAYPNGSSPRETVAIVRESGFHCACSSFMDVVWRGSDRFLLPRYWVGDWDGETFSRRLRLWLPA